MLGNLEDNCQQMFEPRNRLSLPKLLTHLFSNLENLKNPDQIIIRQNNNNRRKKDKQKQQNTIITSSSSRQHEEMKRKIKINLKTKIEKMMKLENIKEILTIKLTEKNKNIKDFQERKCKVRPLTPLKIQQKSINISRQERFNHKNYRYKQIDSINPSAEHSLQENYQRNKNQLQNHTYRWQEIVQKQNKRQSVREATQLIEHKLMNAEQIKYNQLVGHLCEQITPWHVQSMQQEFQQSG